MEVVIALGVFRAESSPMLPRNEWRKHCWNARLSDEGHDARGPRRMPSPVFLRRNPAAEWASFYGAAF